MDFEFNPLKNIESAVLALRSLSPFDFNKIESQYLISAMNSVIDDFYGSYEEYVDVQDSICQDKEISKEDIYNEYQKSKSNGTNIEFVNIVEEMLLRKNHTLM